jgi:hypothetical protein
MSRFLDELSQEGRASFCLALLGAGHSSRRTWMAAAADLMINRRVISSFAFNYVSVVAMNGRMSAAIS